ncbi:MAG: GNAT family N-acetyltransferase [Muribaculaceae bacterium]|nr:GNAT family N-acetyltransferase [Muribaculaceae bacterium]
MKIDAITEIKAALVPTYFPNVELYAMSHNGYLTGFIGLRDDKIEMLFIDSHSRGQGYGSSLIEFALDRGVTKVDANEQNPRVLAFYQAKGFKIIGRDSSDEAGRPYPILHLSP